MEEIEIAHTEFTLWLTLREPLRSTLRSIIGQLAATLYSVNFEPHVTVYSGRSSETKACAVAQSIARQFSPIELTPIRLDHMQLFTKTLFVQFQDSAIVRQMFEVARGYDPQSNYVLNPHLSLLYKQLPEAKRQQLQKMVDFPKGAYCFDRIRLVETETPIIDAGPIQRWRTAYDEPLLGQ